MLKRQIIYPFTQSLTNWQLQLCIYNEIFACVCEVYLAFVSFLYRNLSFFEPLLFLVVFLRELNRWDKSKLFFLFNPYKMDLLTWGKHCIIFTYCVTEESKCVTGVSRHLIHFHTETPRHHREHILPPDRGSATACTERTQQHGYVVIFTMHSFNVTQSAEMFFAHCAVTLETWKPTSISCHALSRWLLLLLFYYVV